MKKFISVFSALAISLSALAPAAFAENTDNDMQSVLESVKERVEIPAECTEFSSGTHTDYGVTSYDFTWRSDDESAYKYVNVECFENGVIVSYSYASDGYLYSSTPSIPAISNEEAKKNAEDFVKKLNPDFPYEVRIEDNNIGNLYNDGYEFNTQIYVNGIRFDDGTGYVSVNGKTGSVSSCSIGYVPVEFPSVENAVSREDAEKSYSEKLGLKMIYRTYTDGDGQETAYPVYVQKSDYGKYINALTGEVTDFIGDTRKYSAYSSAGTAMAEDAAADKGLSEQEIRELENISGLISKADIEKQLRNNKTLSIPDSVSVASIDLSKRYNTDAYIYSIIMSGGENYIYITADAQTGEILSYNRYGGENETELTYQNDKALNALAGDKAKEYAFDEGEQRYVRYVNGIEVQSDVANAVYSGETLTRYSISYTDTEFPPLDNVMSVSDAEKIMFDKDGYEMVYMLSIQESSVEAVPVYKHNTVSINPFTGKYVDYKNEEVSEDDGTIEYSDISGHYAEKCINELAYYGIGFEGGEFRPDDNITQKDFLSLLTSVYRSGIIVLKDNAEQADYVYRNAVRNSIISEEERDDNSAVTREKAAIYMIRAMGAEDYAKYNDIYVSPFEDVTENKGYISLLSAMGVVNGDGNGKFNPKSEITRAESIIMIYNYLTK